MAEQFPQEALTRQIIGACIEVHKHLGAGLLESAYERCLIHELSLRNIPALRQVTLPLKYKGVDIDASFAMDVLVNDEVVLELKSIEKVLPIHRAQILTYLRLSGKKVGLLVNFNVPLLKDGIDRFIN